MRTLRRRVQGFSIVEVLVALLVLSIGMLGIAALYVESLRAGRSAIYRTQAVNLASDMADRIRANRTAGVAFQLAQGDAPAEQGCVDGGVDCSPQQLAEDDLAHWVTSIESQLPGDGGAGTPFGTVEVNAAIVPSQYTITVTWSEPGEPAPLSYVLSMQI